MTTRTDVRASEEEMVASATRKIIPWARGVVIGVLVMIVASAAVIVGFTLEARTEYPELAPVLIAYSVAFAVCHVAVAATLVTLWRVLRRALRDVDADIQKKTILSAESLLAVATAVTGIILVSAVFVPAGSPLFMPVLGVLTATGLCATVAVRRWRQSLP